MEETVAGLLVGLGVFLIFFCIIVVAVAVVVIIGNYKFFQKVGVEGWKAIIPFYNTWTLVEIAGLNWYWFLIINAQVCFAIVSGIVPFLEYFSFLGYAAMIIGNISLFSNLSKKLGKDTGWLVCGVLFGSIVTAIEGFSKNTNFDDKVVVPKDGILEKYINKDNQSNTTNNTDSKSEDKKN